MVNKLVVTADATKRELGFFWIEAHIVYHNNKTLKKLAIKYSLLNINKAPHTAARVRGAVGIDVKEFKSMERTACEAYTTAGISGYLNISFVTGNALRWKIGNFFIGLTLRQSLIFNNHEEYRDE
jgi:hypothetical protein